MDFCHTINQVHKYDLHHNDLQTMQESPRSRSVYCLQPTMDHDENGGYRETRTPTTLIQIWLVSLHHCKIKHIALLSWAISTKLINLLRYLTHYATWASLMQSYHDIPTHHHSALATKAITSSILLYAHRLFSPVFHHLRMNRSC